MTIPPRAQNVASQPAADCDPHPILASGLSLFPDWTRALGFVIQMPVPALLFSHEGMVLVSNQALRALAGGELAAAEQRDIVKTWPFSNEVRSAMTRAMRERTAVTCRDLPFEFDGGSGKGKKWFTLYIFPLHEYGDTVAGGALFFETTDRVLLEGSLRDSERQLSAIFSEARVGLSLIAVDGHFVRVNDELCRMLGRTRDAMLRSGVQDVTHPDDLDNTLKAVGQLLGSGRSVSIDKRYVRSDGEVVFANSIISRLEIGPDAEYSIIAVTVDLTERQRAQNALAESEARFRALAEASSALIWQVDKQGAVIYINPRHQELLGMSSEQLLGYGWAYALHPDDRGEAIDLVKEAINRRCQGKQRVRIRYAGGGWRWMEAHLAPWFAADGSYAGHVGIAFDIDDAVRAQEELHVSNERLRLAIEGSGDGIWDWDIGKDEVVYSARARDILGLGDELTWSAKEFIEQHVHPDDIPLLQTAVNACFSGAMPSLRSEFRVRFPNGIWRWVLSRATVVVESPHSREPQRMTGTITDIAEKRRAEEIVWAHANFDLLTDLPNRRLFRDRLDHEILKSQRTRLPLALLFIDLDRFKEANDLLGHTIGDQLLVEAARRICACVRQSDTVARLGGDEFTAILSELDGGSHVEVVARKINEALARPFCLGNEVVYLSASIGITLYPYDAEDAENLIRNADQAMYVVKNSGRNHFSYFTPSMQSEANERLRLISDLRTAMVSNQLMVFYQPIIDLRSGRVSKAEALLRWLHPTLGLIEPSRFIAFAEEAGLISEIGDWVFREAAHCSQRWGDCVGCPFQISINKSPVQFVSRLNEVDWPSYLDEVGLAGGSVSVEITEGVLLDASPIVSDKLLRYHNAGIKVAIDDFGTGYSSIAYLKKFEVDYLKIDQSFVRDIGSSTEDRAIVRSIIAMAHELGLEVIAEGIETTEQRDFLIEGQCDFGQGFLYSKALPAEEFEQQLRASASEG